MSCQLQKEKQAQSLKIQNMKENNWQTEVQIWDDHNAYRAKFKLCSRNSKTDDTETQVELKQLNANLR